MTSLRTLILAECLPYPPVFGKDLRNWQNVFGLSNLGEVGVFGLRADDPNRHIIPPRQVAVWQATKDPALSNPPPANQLTAARAWPLNPMGHPCDLHFSNAAAEELAVVMANFKPQVVVVEGLWPTRYLNTLKRFDCRIIFDCHNVEAKVYQEIADSRQGDDLPERLFRKLLPSRTKMVEQGAVEIVDQLWVCSDTDKKLMIEFYGDSIPIEVIPNSIDVTSYDAVRDRRYHRPPEVKPIDNVIIFPALFGYQPNMVAAAFLIKDFFPCLANVADCQLLLAGSRPTPEMIEAGQKNPRIIITDTVADMKPYLAASSVMVVPLFQGGGTRFKILEAFAANLPVVSTAKGAEGLAVQDGKHLLIAENVDEFIAGVRRIWAEPGLANHLKTNATELVEREYSLTAATKKIRVAVQHLELANRRETEILTA